MTLHDFLLARITDDQTAARRAVWVDADKGYSVFSYLHTYDAIHVDLHNPSRAIAECEAKRAIVALHTPLDGEDCDPACGDIVSPCRTLAALALPYADHADYREEWRDYRATVSTSA